MEEVEYKNKYFKKKYVKLRKWEERIGVCIVNMFSPKSILDLGCGIGSFLAGSFSAGCEDIIRIELNYDNAKEYIARSIFSYIRCGDVTEDLNLKRKFDCVISIEVAEHIDPASKDIFVKNLVSYSNKYIIFSAAAPGQPGRGHVNLREKSLWIKDIELQGTVMRKDLTKKCRKKWRLLGAPDYLLENLIIFEKKV